MSAVTDAISTLLEVAAEFEHYAMSAHLAGGDPSSSASHAMLCHQAAWNLEQECMAQKALAKVWG